MSDDAGTKTLRLTIDEALVLWCLGRELHKVVPQSASTAHGRDAVQSLSDKLIRLFPAAQVATTDGEQG